MTRLRTSVPIALLGLTILMSACSQADGVPSLPTTPTVVVTPSPSVTPLPSVTPPINFPPLSGPSRTFIFEKELAYPVHEYTRNSRFTLYENGAFTLHYQTVAGIPYRGSYTEENGLLNFSWDPCCAGEATGKLEGESLKVQYSPNMQMSDFEDVVYVRMR